MPYPKLLVTILFFCCGFLGWTQESQQKKSYTTKRISNDAPIIDGLLDDEAWNGVEWGGNFVGHRPTFNVAPSQETKFKILYDDKFLYVGVRAFDTEPEKIVERMSRRDGFDGDFVEINIDSYNDKRTAFSFSASVSGVKGDEYVSNNGDNWDSTWDPIWYLKTSVDSEGWIAEFKIPLSQLRFANRDVLTWGIQFTRRIFRIEERSTWQAVDPNAPGWVHLFGELNGLKGIRPQKQLEIQPYVVGSAQKHPKEIGNPYRETGRDFGSNYGLDAKIGLTSDITLDLTVNPDFGQVDADPSAVNLSAFELFFREQRPFFLEGNNILTFGTSGGRNNLFYSRRIGGPPKGRPEDEDIAYTNFPSQTAILGAAKLTGKNAKGFSWGFQDALTSEINGAVTDTLGNERTEKIEPLTNFMVARFQQDFDEGNTVVGAIFTNINRFNNRGNRLEYLHDNAQSAGVDLNQNLWDRKYGFTVRWGMSQVNGTQGAIYRTQRSPARFFQRPDNFYKEVDSTRTSLTGSFGSLSFGKRSGNLNFEVGSNYRSPELELNDIGFLQNTDNWNHWMFTRYRVVKPNNIFRSQNYGIYTERNYDFGGVLTGGGSNVDVDLELNNLWNFGTGLWIGNERSSNSALRGGPSMLLPGNFNVWYFIGTNRQKKIRVGWNQWFDWGNDDSGESMGISLNITARPIDALSLSLSPNINWSDDRLQYVFNELESEGIYLLGRIQQKTYSMTIRANYNITPNLTLEFWGQPFVSTGQYSAFKRVTDSDHDVLANRYLDISPDWITSKNGLFEIDENGDQLTDYYLEDPDFNLVEWRSNMVMRWEYIPGSTLFVVWSNNGSFFDQSERNGFRDLNSQLTNLTGTNTFLLKYTYRFVL